MPSSLPIRSATSHSHVTMERLRHRWGWFVALGALAVLFGLAALALVISATLAAVYAIAIFMIIAGGSEIVVGLGSKSWGRAFLWAVAGLFYIVAGAFALAQPGHAAVILTLMLGISLIATGITRIYIGSHLHTHARTMVIVGGIVTLLVGLLVIMGWPNNSIIILGTLLGVDLLFTGVTWIGFGLRLRSHA
ncbi:HdeD family acid-resistance protein [Beijerinckia sp. L45]|uniref:HdeD family acid-resistance protein n=1 Tax=Beijerinckia sp. L45 TaxID=1641855 RepID=UPI00131B3108|nr:HdeD family acid-resistance protein [Beijerinckia sp. L45]